MNTKYKVLVAEDEIKIREILVDFLSDDYEVIEAKDGEEALRLFHSQQIDLVLLDLMMPGKDGFSVLKEIRLVSKVPMMILTARSSVEDQVKGYDLKVDDYVTKPFDHQILLAKINRLLARANEDDDVETYEFAFDGLVVNKLSRTVRIDNELVDFRPKEFDLLVFLIENHRIALDRDRILDAVWGIDYFGDTRVVDTHIKKIRKKLGRYSKYLHTVFGVGYKFEVI
ncbi:MAG: response regulator transcription factor [Turicibacter sp.]|nr:response regulator transcription factor [Turicibacter sp.]